jgi:hypothetical protein
VEIASFEWRRPNIAEPQEHGIAPWEVDELRALGTWAARVHPDYPGQVRIVGPTAAGRFLTIALAPTEDPAIWRPVTGWPSTAAELAYYRQAYP